MDEYATRLRNALVQQHEKCFDYEAKTLKPEYAQHIDCPVCGANDGQPHFEKDWFRFVRCRRCRMVYLNPRLTEQATYDFYNSPWNAIYNERKFDIVSTCSRMDDEINLGNLRLIERTREDGRQGNLLEIGVGKGYLAQKAKEAGYNVWGVELNEKNVACARQLVGDTITCETLFDAKYPDGWFDVAYMRDVFEHVPNPWEMLVEINRVSKPGALLYIEVPNIEGLIYSIVRHRHVVVFGFEHLNFWSPGTLADVMRRTGYSVVSVHHESLDCTLRQIGAHFLGQAGHAVHWDPPVRWLRALARVVVGVCARQPARSIDETLTPWIADSLGRGSVIRVLARKTHRASGE